MEVALQKYCTHNLHLLTLMSRLTLPLSADEPRQGSYNHKDKETKQNRDFTEYCGFAKHRVTIFIGWSKRNSGDSGSDDSDEFLKAAIAFGFGKFDATSHSVD